MNHLKQLTSAYERAEARFQEIMTADESQVSATYTVDETFGEGTNAVICADNLDYMIHLLKEKDMAGKLNLVYVDPPFFSGEKYMSSINLNSDMLGKSPVIKIGAYNDKKGEDLENYLYQLTIRLMLMRELMTNDGSIWLHLDRHVIHYARIIMDMIFGENNFINEIIWTYKSGGAGKRSFAKKHDNILGYGKTTKYKFNAQKEKSYNRGFKPYRFKGVEEFQDEIGWYTMVNMKDVWSIDMVGRTSSERQGYATQKPEKLVERIIASCSDEGDICADFYGGSGTFAAACDKMNRRWITADTNPAAAAAQVERLKNSEAGFEVISDGNWPEGEVSLASGMIVDYRAPIDGVESSHPEVLEQFMDQDGKSFIKFWQFAEDEGGTYIWGYDVLGNKFKKHLSE